MADERFEPLTIYKALLTVHRTAERPAITQKMSKEIPWKDATPAMLERLNRVSVTIGDFKVSPIIVEVGSKGYVSVKSRRIALGRSAA